MNDEDLKNDLHLLKDCELVRYLFKGDALVLQVVADNEEDEHEHEHEDEHEHEEHDHDCCMEGLNGHLFIITFTGVSDFKTSGEECDNYVLKNMVYEDGFLSLSYDGKNLFEPDAELEFSFRFKDIDIEDGGKIESPEV